MQQYVGEDILRDEDLINVELSAKRLKRVISFLIPSIILIFLTFPIGDTLVTNRESPILPINQIVIQQITPIDISFPTPPSWVSWDIIRFIRSECDNPKYKIKVPYLLVFKLIEYESGWNQKRTHPNKDSKGKITSTDYGYMMINSLNIKEFIKKYRDTWRTEKSYDPIRNVYDNIQLGIRHLRDVYEQQGTWTQAIIAYNGGPIAAITGNVKAGTDREVQYVIPVEGWWKFPESVRIHYTIRK